MAGSPYWSNMIVTESVVYLAGCIGVDADGVVVPGHAGDRTRQILLNIEERLATVGLDLRDCGYGSNQLTAVVSVTIFITDYANMALVNEAWAATMPADVPPPCRACIGAASLPGGTDIEMFAVSVLHVSADIRPPSLASTSS